MTRLARSEGKCCSYAKVPPAPARARDHAAWDTCSGRPRAALALQCVVGSGARRRRLGRRELGVGGHTVVRGWVWPGAVNQEILPNEREVRQFRQPTPT